MGRAHTDAWLTYLEWMSYLARPKLGDYDVVNQLTPSDSAGGIAVTTSTPARWTPIHAYSRKTSSIESVDKSAKQHDRESWVL